jgi:hypothetical protein
MEKQWRRHAQCGACPQNHCVKWLDIDSKYEGNSEHAFITDQLYFQTCIAIDWGHQGNEASGREVNVRNEFARAVKHLGKNELDWFAICEQLFAILAG